MTTESKAAARPWLFGPVTDLAVGCGAAYLVAFAALSLVGDAVREAIPLGLMFIPLTLLSVPHYGATLLRVYERAEDRRHYRFFAVSCTAAIAALFVWGARDAWIASWTVTVYLTWSPWHYAGQNFGVGMMFLRRRGVDVTPWARRLYWWSFSLSFVLTFLALHGEMPSASYAPDELKATTFRFHTAGIPGPAQTGLLLGVGAVYAIVTVGAFVLLARRTALRNLVPAAVLVLSQALWFSIPTVARYTGALSGIEPFSERQQHYGFLWIASAHAAQYLWITSWYATRSGGLRRHAAFFAKSFAAGALVWTVPGLLFAPGFLGRLSYDTGLALLVAAAVNLHHFVLDGAIWKLRDGRIARILLGPPAPPSAPDAAPRGRVFPWFAAAGAAAIGVLFYVGFETEYGFTRPVNDGDLESAASSLGRLAALGRDGADMHLAVANRAAEKGDVVLARREFDASIRAQPTVWGWVGLGRLEARAEKWSDARVSLSHALELDPGHAVALLYAGVVDMETGRPAEGRAKILRARAAAEDDAVRREADEVMRIYGVN